LTVSVVVSADVKQKKLNHVRIALGPVAFNSFRAKEAERILASTSISMGDEEAARKAAQEANPRQGLLRGSEGYRREMVANLVERAIHKGLERLEVRHG